MRIMLIFLVTLCGIALSNATICVPYTRFKIDCNQCFCSGDGTEYSCTKISCSEQKVSYDDQDYISTRRRGKVQYPNEDEDYQNDVHKDTDWDDVKANTIENDDGNIYDESGDDNSIDIDEEVPSDYRYKKPY